MGPIPLHATIWVAGGLWHLQAMRGLGLLQLPVKARTSEQSMQDHSPSSRAIALTEERAHQQGVPQAGPLFWGI